MMGRLRIGGMVGLAVALAGPAWADNAAVRRAVERGRLIARFDHAAWVGTDDLLARLPTARKSLIGGWIVTANERGEHIDFFGKDALADRVLYAADVVDGRVGQAVIPSAGAEPALSPVAHRQVVALAVARAELLRHGDWRPCTAAPFNTVVLPEVDGVVPVYFLSAQVENDRWPLGGHYEIDVTTATGTVRASRAFARTCLTMGPPPPSAGGAPAALFVTHVLDPQPTEIHVFEQGQVRLPLYVGVASPAGLWWVNDGTITRVGELPPRSPGR